MTSTPAGFVVTILYRHWHLPDPVSTPPRSSILRHPSPVWTYMGPTLTEGWFPEIFGGTTTTPKATLITLTRSSTGLPTALGAVPGGLSDLATLPDIFEIYRSSAYLPPSYVGMVAPNPRLTAPAPLIPTCGGESVDPLRVYLTLHTSTGFSPLHSAVNYGTFRISLCLLYTHDHLSWTAAVFHEAVEKLLPRPSNQAILLTGILLRALWDHDASDHPSSLCIHLPDPTLLRSLRSPPTTYSNEVTEWLHELAHL